MSATMFSRNRTVASRFWRWLLKVAFRRSIAREGYSIKQPPDERHQAKLAAYHAGRREMIAMEQSLAVKRKEVRELFNQLVDDVPYDT